MFKNRLQEMFQKRSLPLPVYNTSMVGGEAHTPQWLCVVFYQSNNGRVKQAKGEIKSSKTDAEQSAARIALEDLETGKGATTLGDMEIERKASTFLKGIGPVSPPDTKSLEKTKKEPFSLSRGGFADEKVGGEKPTKRGVKTRSEHTCLLIDVENLPNILSELLASLKTVPDTLHIYIFVGKHHNKSSYVSGEEDKHVKKVICEGFRKDGVDSMIQVYTGAFLHDETFDKYLIATRDHFAASLVDCITAKDMLWKSKEADVVSTVEHIVQNLTL